MTEIERAMIDLYVSAYFSLSSVQALCSAIDGMDLSSRLNLDTQLLRMRDLIVSESFERKLYLLEQMGKTASLHIREQTITSTNSHREQTGEIRCELISPLKKEVSA